MAIISKTKEYLAAKATAAAKSVTDGIAKTSSLSPAQLLKINDRRIGYFTEKPDMTDDEIQKLIQRNLGSVSIEVYQAYLECLKTVYLPMRGNVNCFDEYNRIRFFDITKWVADPKEQNLDKLVNVYQVLSEEECNIALIYNRTAENCQVTMAVVNTDEEESDPARAESFYQRLVGAIRGNFPGVEISSNNNTGIPCSLRDIVQTTNGRIKAKSVAVVSNTASEKSEDFISQSMEKLLDGIVPTSEHDSYTIVLLAKPLNDQLATKNKLFELYSKLAPYASWQTNFTFIESEAENSSASMNVNLGMGIRQFPGKDTHGIHRDGNFGANFSRSSSVTVQLGKNEGVSQTYTNYGVKHTLEVIEKQFKRLDESTALGMWEFAAYVIAQSPVTVNNVAHMYLALTQGDESYITQAAINMWDGEVETDQAAIILENIQKLQHPVFGLKDSIDEDRFMYPSLATPSAEISGKELAKALNFPRKSVSGLPVFETTPFGREVQKCVSISDCNVSRVIEIGAVFHMRQKEASIVRLDVNDLASHTFITGSTGTGKSNAIYQLLLKLRDEDIRFLVVEPAKGEYKDVFGGYEDVEVYGTNPIKPGKLLQINPFSFPEEVHVLEHIDRLVEILNACWPMYAAMPAVMKDAIEKAYERYGWNLRTSTCVKREFPNFGDLLEELPNVLEGSYFSGDTKGDYEGALITRVKSMTNGINGLVLCPESELTDEELFDNNVIVDISRVGSVETKSLYMGILVMKLQEYRMQQASDGKALNQNLRHVTVLEEAHNLLRKTSVAQSQEGANLQGKSVEMITNAIAEMRTYGEGFIIADQAPGMLDEAVIRNTNTKIILRLPDGDDRELAGKAVALSDSQVQEIAKLPKGVAVVYQNDWVEAVLCQFEKFPEEKQKMYSFVADFSKKEEENNVSKNFFEIFFERKRISDFEALECNAMKKWVNGLKVNPYTKRYLYDCLDGKQLEYDVQTDVMYNLFEGKAIAKKLENTFDEEAAIDAAEKMIYARFDLQDHELSRIICRYVVDSICRQLETGRLVDRFKNYDWRKIR